MEGRSNPGTARLGRVPDLSNRRPGGGLQDDEGTGGRDPDSAHGHAVGHEDVHGEGPGWIPFGDLAAVREGSGLGRMIGRILDGSALSAQGQTPGSYGFRLEGYGHRHRSLR